MFKMVLTLTLVQSVWVRVGGLLILILKVSITGLSLVRRGCMMNRSVRFREKLLLLYFLFTSGMALSATVVYKCIDTHISEKKDNTVRHSFGSDGSCDT